MTTTAPLVLDGPSRVLETSQLVIRTALVSEAGNDAYLLTCRATGEQLLVDAADHAPRLLLLLREGRRDGHLAQVLTTHRHGDHTGALAEVVAATSARTLAGEDDADALPVPVDVRLAHGDEVVVGEVVLRAVHLRGHTPGSIALVHRDADGSTHAFTGDSLFPGGVGNTQKDPVRFAQLLGDVEERLFCLPDDTVVHPGHGEGTTLGAERPHLGEWRERGW